MNFQFKITSISDQELIEKVSQAMKAAGINLSAATGTLIGGQVADGATFQEAVKFGRALQSIRFSEGGECSVHFDRAVQTDPAAGFVDNVEVRATTAVAPLQFARFAAALRDALPSVDSLEYINALKASDRQIHLARQKEINELTGAQLKFFDDLRTFQYQQAEYHNKREVEQETRHRELIDKLEEEGRTNQESYDKQKAELEETKKALDLRDATAVRRELRTKLQEQVQKNSNMQLSPRTAWRRAEVLLVYSVFLGILGGLVYYVNIYADKPATGSPLDWFWYVRQVGVTVTFVVAVSFFLRWLNQWFVKHAEEEFRLKRLGLDIDRGAWVFETAISWSEEKEHSPLPQYLIESLSKNLFMDGEPHDTSLTAADSLASAVLGSAAKLKLNVPGGEIEMNRRGLKQLGNTEIE